MSDLCACNRDDLATSTHEGACCCIDGIQRDRTQGLQCSGPQKSNRSQQRFRAGASGRRSPICAQYLALSPKVSSISLEYFREAKAALLCSQCRGPYSRLVDMAKQVSTRHNADKPKKLKCGRQLWILLASAWTAKPGVYETRVKSTKQQFDKKGASLMHRQELSAPRSRITIR